MTRRNALIAAWLVVLGLAALLPLSALLRGIIHVGPSPVAIPAGSDRPTIAIGSDVLIPAGSHSIVVSLFGDVHAAGQVRDDVVAVSGRIYLQRGVHASGDVLSLLGGGIYKSDGVSVTGRIGGALHPWNGKPLHPSHDFGSILGGSARLGLAAGLALLLAGTCLTIVFPWQIVLISTTLRASPWKSILAAIFSALTFTFLVVPLGLSLAGLPFAILLSAAASLAWLFGMTASAVLLGRLMAHGPASLLWAAAAGLVLLALTMVIPVIGPLVVTATGVIGAGALAVALVDRATPVSPLP